MQNCGVGSEDEGIKYEKEEESANENIPGYPSLPASFPLLSAISVR